VICDSTLLLAPLSFAESIVNKPDDRHYYHHLAHLFVCQIQFQFLHLANSLALTVLEHSYQTFSLLNLQIGAAFDLLESNFYLRPFGAAFFVPLCYLRTPVYGI
jgi:hypothetical protein